MAESESAERIAKRAIRNTLACARRDITMVRKIMKQNWKKTVVLQSNLDDLNGRIDDILKEVGELKS